MTPFREDVEHYYYPLGPRTRFSVFYAGDKWHVIFLAMGKSTYIGSHDEFNSADTLVNELIPHIKVR